MTIKMYGLIIKKIWLDKILEEGKIWEIRGTSTAKRGKIALIQSGSLKIFGVCEIIDVKGPLSLNTLKKNIARHKIPTKEIKNITHKYKRIYAWVLRNPRRFKTPKKYKHPHGAVIWVNLSNQNV